MNDNRSLETLLILADEQLKDCIIVLGRKQKAYAQADGRLTQLQDYYQTYHTQMQHQAETMGVRSDLLNVNQNFLNKLEKIISDQRQQVALCFQDVEQQRGRWRQDTLRFNMFNVLKRRRDDIRALTDARHEQKLMDDFALRSISRQGL